MKGLPVNVVWENLPLEERKRRIEVREATSQMMQGSIVVNDPHLIGIA